MLSESWFVVGRCVCPRHASFVAPFSWPTVYISDTMWALDRARGRRPRAFKVVDRNNVRRPQSNGKKVEKKLPTGATASSVLLLCTAYSLDVAQ
jgi:hypothetical protein